MKWKRVHISSVCLPTETVDPQKTPNRIFDYVDISSINKDTKTIETVTEIVGEEAPSRARKEIRTGDVLVSTVRPNLNAVAIVPPEYDKQVASTGFCVLRANEELISKRFLFYWTLTPEFVNHLTSRMRGANYPAVSDDVVKTSVIPLPPLSEQRRIVEILDQADALRKKRREADAIAERILPALFYKMFGDPVRNEKGFDKVTLKEAGAVVRYGLGQPPKPSSQGVRLIRATNIDHGKILEKDLMFVDPADVPPDRNAFLGADEVLVVRSGAYTGDIAQVTKKYAGSVAGYDLVVTPGEKLVAEFLESYLLTSFVQKYYFANLKARAGQPHLNATQLEDTPVLLPNKEIQETYARNVSDMRDQREHRVASGMVLDELFASLLHRVFSGELILSEA